MPLSFHTTKLSSFRERHALTHSRWRKIIPASFRPRISSSKSHC